ncbi:acyl-CoA carboxylase subunit epsilon [Microlunatus aurantiacus]|uniref:acyl-CoA carboxylase subunit epsilon n=1 Tax=Microlunatus aurantiacus TaxID=446786 RepID=UPI0031DB0274
MRASGARDPADAEGDDAPVVRVVAGHPTPEDLAALVVALATVTPVTTGAGAAATPSGWADRSRGLRRSLRAGPQAWRLSGRLRAE